MAQPTSAAVTLARHDADLRQRLIAAAAILDVPNPEWWVDQNMYALVVAEVNGESGDTVASVYKYAYDTYNPTPRPGENMAAVNDTNLLEAVAAVHDPSVGNPA